MSSSSICPMFQSLDLNVSSQRQSTVGTIKIGVQETIRNEKVCIPIDKAQQMLGKPLQLFLNTLTDYSTPNVNLLHLRAMSSIFVNLGYTLEKIFCRSSVKG